MNAKKQARRDRAAKRFSILSQSAWQAANICDSSAGKYERFERLVGSDRGWSDRGYAAYVARKQQEAAALGL